MALFPAEQLEVAEAIGSLAVTNPFLEHRLVLEKRILSDRFRRFSSLWSVNATLAGHNPNLLEIQRKAESLIETALGALASGEKPDNDREQESYENLALYVLFYRYEDKFYERIIDSGDSTVMPFWPEFKRDVEKVFGRWDLEFGVDYSRGHLFAVFFQLRRAFHFTFRHILGGSIAIARLRAAVWESILTVDVRRYLRVLYRRMNDFATLVTGPSGTGKDLVAAAIGLARYIPFDEKKERFEESFGGTFHPLNLSALSPTLIEAELFGHCKGAFTGATSDRQGYLDDRKKWHSVFLDEIGDVDPEIQVKLLRVLQSGEFNRLGDRSLRRFEGKIIAATNRCLAQRISEGSFRLDLYYRLCSDLVVTPSLFEQIDGSPEELRNLIALITSRLLPGAEGDAVADEVFSWTTGNLGADYPWPGNMRELTQCVHNYLVRGEYRPLAPCAQVEGADGFVNRVSCGELTQEQLLSGYTTLVFAKTGQYLETARRLDIDRRTVKSRIDEELLKKIKEGG